MNCNLVITKLGDIILAEADNSVDWVNSYYSAFFAL